MNNEEISNKTLREFLIGKLDEANTDRLDELSIISRDFADRLNAEQYELVDDWVGGRLDTEEHKAFELILARSPDLREKVEVSRMLAKAAPRAVVVERSAEPGFLAGLFGGWPRIAYGFGGFAILLGVIGFAVFLLRREGAPDISRVDPPVTQTPAIARPTAQPSASLDANTNTEPQKNTDSVNRVAPTPAPTRRVTPVFATLVLAPPTRGTSNIRSVKLETGVEYLRLSLQTEASSSGRFLVEVGDPSSGTDWRSAPVRGRSDRGRTVVSVRVPAAILKNGLRGIRLLDAGEGAELLDEHVIRIER